MKASLSRKEIITRFDELDYQLTVMIFRNGERVLTYAGCNSIDALEEIARQTGLGREVRILVDPPKGVDAINNLSDVPKEYLWRPSRIR